MRSKSGMRIAGSVGASTAPIRSPVENGTSNATAATEPATSAVTTTPGIASSPRPTATRLSTRVESWSPPWKRMNDTPSVSRSCAPDRVERDVDRIEERRAEHDSGSQEHEHPRDAQQVRDDVADEPRPEHDAQGEDDVLDRHPGDSALRGGQRRVDGDPVTAPSESRTMLAC